MKKLFNKVKLIMAFDGFNLQNTRNVTMTLTLQRIDSKNVPILLIGEDDEEIGEES